jgi:acetyl-CoA carboxylase biotin carboxyl carrier protein
LSDLTPEDVQEILRLVEQSHFDEFELETPRFSIRFRREAIPAAEPDAASQAADGLVEVTAPSVGTFYRASAPGAAPFVHVGTAVEPETQVCILEVMKLMNAVYAGTRGVVTEVCRDDGEAVVFGDVLFRVRAE